MPSIPHRLFALLGAALTLSSVPASALVVYGSGPNDTDNDRNALAPDTLPPNGAPSDHVAQFGPNNASGVYLGNGFVLTANHVSLVNSGIVIKGVSYNRDTSFGPLQISESPHAVDLKLIRIVGWPSAMVLGPLPINDAVTEDAQACTIIGFGLGKGAIIADQGWYWGGDNTRAERWGTNVAYTTPISYSGYHYPAIVTEFARALGPDTAQLALGDSGCGLFQQFGGVWKLSGIGTAVGSPIANSALYDGDLATADDQPDVSAFVRLSSFGHLLRYENWARAKLGSPTASPTADPDNDGFGNLLEYAFHTDPNSGASFSAPMVGVEPGFVAITYTRLMSATDLSYGVESTLR